MLLSIITSANIACGGHAGDERTMTSTVRQALACGVRIGAHPSFPDREGFGRRAMTIPRAELIALLADQVGTLQAIAARQGARLQHVKPHGALYNMAAEDHDLAAVIGEAIRQVDPTLIVVALAGAPVEGVLEGMGLRVAAEGFLDRGYTAAGALVPRDRPGAVLVETAAVAARAVQFVRAGTVVAIDGTVVTVHADTLCLHGDTPHATTFARVARKALEDAGMTIAAMETFL